MNEDEKFLFYTQQEKMKELWDNEYDAEWEKLEDFSI